jgi:hypothetical protein
MDQSGLLGPNGVVSHSLPPALQELLKPDIPDPEHIFISFKANPSARAYSQLPRYLLRVGEGTNLDKTFKSYLEAKKIYLPEGEDEILISPKMIAPFGA